MSVKKLTEGEFEEIINGKKPVLVDFYADWCGPCKMQSPIIDEVAAELSDKIVVAKMNTDDCFKVCLKFNISSIPTLILFKEGELKERSVGLTEKKEISDMVIKYI